MTAQAVTVIMVIITNMAKLISITVEGVMMQATVAIQLVAATINRCRLTSA